MRVRYFLLLLLGTCPFLLASKGKGNLRVELMKQRISQSKGSTASEENKKRVKELFSSGAQQNLQNQIAHFLEQVQSVKWAERIDLVETLQAKKKFPRQAFAYLKEIINKELEYETYPFVTFMVELDKEAVSIQQTMTQLFSLMHVKQDEQWNKLVIQDMLEKIKKQNITIISLLSLVNDILSVL